MRLSGLRGRRELNGLLGTVERHDTWSDRYAVRLDGRKKESLLAKADNLARGGIEDESWLEVD